MDTTPDQPTLVEVIAPRCGQCRALRPAIETVAGRHPGVALRVIDASTEPDTVAALGVKGTPTLIGFRNGMELFRSTGRPTPAELESMFEAVAGDADIRVGSGDMVLRVGAGATLTILGLVSGPVWPLVGIGTVVGLVGFLPMRNRHP